jgi:hypothetical protein
MRRRYVYRETAPGVVEAFEIGANAEVAPRLQVMSESHYEGLRSTDGVPIDTRKRHRDYMRANNLCLADEIKPDVERAQRERAAVRDGVANVGARREALIRALERGGKR